MTQGKRQVKGETPAPRRPSKNCRDPTGRRTEDSRVSSTREYSSDLPQYLDPHGNSGRIDLVELIEVAVDKSILR